MYENTRQAWRIDDQHARIQITSDSTNSTLPRIKRGRSRIQNERDARRVRSVVRPIVPNRLPFHDIIFVRSSSSSSSLLFFSPFSARGIICRIEQRPPLPPKKKKTPRRRVTVYCNHTRTRPQTRRHTASKTRRRRAGAFAPNTAASAHGL